MDFSLEMDTFLVEDEEDVHITRLRKGPPIDRTKYRNKKLKDYLSEMETEGKDNV